MAYLQPQELIKLVVTNVSTTLGSTIKYSNGNAIGSVHFFWGHPYEVVAHLEALTVAKVGKDKKFPLIALFTDFDQDMSLPGILCETSLHLIIATVTDSKLNAEDRLIKNFKPILQPIYDEFIKEVKRCGYFEPMYEIPHTKTDRYYWGKNGLFGQNEVKFSDFIDCIELQNFKLKVKKIKSNCIT